MYKQSYLEAKLDENPFTFLHVINPEFSAENKTLPNTFERYNAVKEKFIQFKKDQIFLQDQEESLYVYRQQKDGNQYLGIIAGANVDQYLSGSIKKHEETLSTREQMFTSYLSVVEFNAEPVLLFHEKNEELNNILNKIVLERPEYEFTTTEKITHELWVVSNPEIIKSIQDCYLSIKDVYIADGHHRCASSAKYAKDIGAKNDEIKNHFLAYFISEEKLEIREYNRVIKDLNGYNAEAFLQKLETSFFVEACPEGEIKPSARHIIQMYLGGVWYRLIAKEGTFDEQDPVFSLDTDILTKNILYPILGIADIREDARIEFLSSKKGALGVQKMIDEGDALVGFVLHPVSPGELKKVADLSRIMPPKSTWIEPKMRSGLTIYPLNDID